VRLLTGEHLEPALDPDGWREIAAWAGHVPRVLMLLNVLLRSGAVTPQDLLHLRSVQTPREFLAQAEDALRESMPADALGELAVALEDFP
jgi:hypothetical protein